MRHQLQQVKRDGVIVGQIWHQKEYAGVSREGWYGCVGDGSDVRRGASSMIWVDNPLLGAPGPFMFRGYRSPAEAEEAVLGEFFKVCRR